MGAFRSDSMLRRGNFTPLYIASYPLCIPLVCPNVENAIAATPEAREAKIELRSVRGRCLSVTEVRLLQSSVAYSTQAPERGPALPYVAADLGAPRPTAYTPFPEAGAPYGPHEGLRLDTVRGTATPGGFGAAAAIAASIQRP